MNTLTKLVLLFTIPIAITACGQKGPLKIDKPIEVQENQDAESIDKAEATIEEVQKTQREVLQPTK